MLLTTKFRPLDLTGNWLFIPVKFPHGKQSINQDLRRFWSQYPPKWQSKFGASPRTHYRFLGKQEIWEVWNSDQVKYQSHPSPFAESKKHLGSLFRQVLLFCPLISPRFWNEVDYFNQPTGSGWGKLLRWKSKKLIAPISQISQFKNPFLRKNQAFPIKVPIRSMFIKPFRNQIAIITGAASNRTGAKSTKSFHLIPTSVSDIEQEEN